jgi:sulfofructose kinase
MSSRAPSVLCLGIVSWDSIYRVPRVPPPPDKVMASDCVQVGGGMSASAAVAAVRLGGRAEWWGRCGDDVTGDLILDELRREGVGIDRVRRVAGCRSPVAAILVDARGERLVVPYYDQALDRDPAWLPIERIAAFDAMLVDVRWPEGAARGLDAARAAGVPAMVDADIAPPGILEDLVPRAHHVVFSEPALLAFAGADTIAAALPRIAGIVPGIVGATGGERGFFWLDGGRVAHVPAPQVDAIDTLGAGDVFHGALVLALAEGRPVADAGRFAAIAASISCTRFGGRSGCPRRAEVEAFRG